ncbi:MAG: CoA-binding protein, partial [Tannerella sp.]|nr:CoA-binding protein [Tannerella sp.]
MINKELINPRSIVVVGGSNKTSKPGGNCIRNLLNGGFAGELYAVNAKETDVQGLKCYASVDDIPQTDLAVISVPAAACLDVVTTLAEKKGVKAFIMFTAGFGETSAEGGLAEKQIVEVIDRAGA